MSDQSGSGGDGKAAAGDGQVYANTKHGPLGLDTIGSLMPGLGSLMPIISDRFGWMVHAARGGNWELARYQQRKVVKLFRVGQKTRPKWTAVIDAYVDDFLVPLRTTIDAADTEALEAAAQAAVDEANRIHVHYGYGYIAYKIPEHGPAHMETGPGGQPAADADDPADDIAADEPPNRVPGD